MVLGIILIIGMRKLFVKAGRPGWESIIPIYGLYILTCEIAKKPISIFILALVPCVQIIGLIVICIEVAKKFGKGTGYGIGMVLLGFIFIPMLGFGSAVYEGGGEAAVADAGEPEGE